MTPDTGRFYFLYDAKKLFSSLHNEMHTRLCFQRVEREFEGKRSLILDPVFIYMRKLLRIHLNLSFSIWIMNSYDGNYWQQLLCVPALTSRV